MGVDNSSDVPGEWAGRRGDEASCAAKGVGSVHDKPTCTTLHYGGGWNLTTLLLCDTCPHVDNDFYHLRSRSRATRQPGVVDSKNLSAGREDRGPCQRLGLRKAAIHHKQATTDMRAPRAN